jgi:hypothetical protein
MQRISLRRTIGGDTVQLMLDRAPEQISLRASVRDHTTARRVDPGELRALDEAVAAAHVPVSPGGAADPTSGGVTLTLHFEGLESHFHWTGDPPKGWEPLGRIAESLLALQDGSGKGT